MGRPPRIDFPGAMHHVFCQAHRQQPLFADPDICAAFLSILAVLPEEYGVRIHGFVLMHTHYHLFVESTEGRLSDAMQYLGSQFGRSVNRRKRWKGAVFAGRFQNKLIQSDAHLLHLLPYIHNNPVRSSARCDAPGDWVFSSFHAYVDPNERPAWLTTDHMIAAFGSRKALLEYTQDMVAGKVPTPEGFDDDKQDVPEPEDRPRLLACSLGPRCWRRARRSPGSTSTSCWCASSTCPTRSPG